MTEFRKENGEKEYPEIKKKKISDLENRDGKEINFKNVTQICIRYFFSQPIFNSEKDIIPFFVEIEEREEKLYDIYNYVNNGGLVGGNSSFKRVELKKMKEVLEKEILEIQNKIVVGNMWFAIKIARRYIGISQLEFLDLIQEGALGVMEAVRKFDYKRGAKFLTYARWCVRHSIERKICNDGFTIRIPVHIHENLIKIHGLEENFLRKNSRFPDEQELSEISGFSVEKLRELREVFLRKKLMSLDAPIGNYSLTFYDIKPEWAKTPEKLVEDLEIIERALSPKELFIIKNRFGYESGMTLQEIGNVLNLTRERVCQIEKDALSKLMPIDTLRAFSEFFPALPAKILKKRLNQEKKNKNKK